MGRAVQEAGLIGEWYNWYLLSASKCMNLNERKRIPRLSMKHLSSAFVILIAGYVASLVAFVGEKIVEKRMYFN